VVQNSPQAIHPIDPQSGGTWIAGTDAGLALAILNVNPRHPQQAPGRKSRGLIIPELLGALDLSSALRMANDIDTSVHSPFRLILAAQGEVAEVLWTGDRWAVRRQRVEGPLLYTSSGLGDERVSEPRSRLFASLFSGNNLPARQASFHRHSWAQSPELSVCMRRGDACTVSMTTVEIGNDALTMTYHPGPPDELAEPFTNHLWLATAGVP
jgi:hypothetical protein